MLIAALARNGIIGVEGALPWRLPDDLARFKRLTIGKPIVMGRKTYASIGRPLPKRRNVVVSRTAPATEEGIEVVRSVDEALSLLAGSAEICVIGGGEIYRAFLPLATKLELTHVEVDVDGDVSFPEVDPASWTLAAEGTHASDEAHRHAMRFATYVRRS